MKVLANHRVVWSVVVAGLSLAMTVLIVGYHLGTYGPSGAIQAWYLPLTGISTSLIAMLVGGVIATRSPYPVYGWIWILLGFGFGAMQPLGVLVATLALSSSPEQVFLGGIAVYLTGLFWLLSVSMLPFVLLLYPTGALPSPRWRWVPRVMFLVIAATALAAWAVPGPSGVAPVDNPFGLPGVIGKAAEIITIGGVGAVLIVIFPVCAVSLVLRYRQARGLHRAQLRWLAFAAGINFVFAIFQAIELNPAWISEEILTMISDLLLATLPVAVAVAMLRYRLYDIDILIRRTLVYSAMMILLALVYFGGVTLLEGLFTSLTGEQSTAAVVISTLAIAALFSPLRKRVQDFIDRRFYRQKYNAEHALAQFAQTASKGTDLEIITKELLQTIQKTLQPESASSWVIKGQEHKR
jgi:hypothetical protein